MVQKSKDLLEIKIVRLAGYSAADEKVLRIRLGDVVGVVWSLKLHILKKLKKRRMEVNIEKNDKKSFNCN